MVGSIRQAYRPYRPYFTGYPRRNFTEFYVWGKSPGTLVNFITDLLEVERNNYVFGETSDSSS